MYRKLKESAEKVFAYIGLDATTAVRMFYSRVANTQSIPFPLRVEPEFTPEQEEEILRATEEEGTRRLAGEEHRQSRFTTRRATQRLGKSVELSDPPRPSQAFFSRP